MQRIVGILEELKAMNERYGLTVENIILFRKICM